ncbi:hypothetical protein Tco_0917374 [Tanacetum coccineum]
MHAQPRHGHGTIDPMYATKGDTDITNQSIPMLATKGDTDIINQSIPMLVVTLFTLPFPPPNIALED